ncbi:hypothetical protein ElyMa_000385800 [Elysia marginata]|uniref:Uncharacterized protein n=1 Tax=Elysia marginata TaxID=1093978 RepID=A0AAV4FH46_9GAST|nr:hypothetical protein ElyMa_000385800 [Elysia marginata]
MCRLFSCLSVGIIPEKGETRLNQCCATKSVQVYRPLSASNAADHKAVDKMILGNRCIKQKDIAKELEISKERVQHIITDILGYRNLSVCKVGTANVCRTTETL